MTSELYVMKVDRCVPLWHTYITLYRDYRGVVGGDNTTVLAVALRSYWSRTYIISEFYIC
jgi:hypothetical protein